jgi:hypothetical protein
MTDVPITSIIDVLSHLSHRNYILAPRISGMYHNHAGKVVSEPFRTFRWENLTPEQAFKRLCQENGLSAVNLPGTPIDQITNFKAKPATVDTTPLDGSTNTIIPLIEFNQKKLSTALEELAKTVRVQIVIEPKLLAAAPFSTDEDSLSTLVTMYCEKVTAKQAIVAICENFELDLVKDSTNGPIRIEYKK